MQLSSYARKAAATGLAASTLLMAAAGFAPSIASAQVHSEGCLVLSGGIVWMITGGTRRGYTSAEVFQSYGYNFAQVNTASAEDVALPVGPIMIYADGTLVKGPSDPLVYLVAGGQKRPFVSGSVFTGLGYSFANIQSAPYNTFADLPTGSNLDNATIAHPAGTNVISNGAVWQMAANGRMGFTSGDNFLSYGYMFSHVVAANSADLASPNLGNVPARPACTGGTVNPPASGPVSVSLSSDTPASGTVIGGTTAQGQADLAHFAFSGSGSVTSVTLKRIGVSADTDLQNVFLFDGATRITDASSVSSGSLITFNNASGLFNVNGSKTISVRVDMATTSTAGESVGIQLVSAMSGSTAVSGAPVSGNLFNVAIASLATLTMSSAVGSGNSDPGNGITVWQGTATVGTRDVLLTRLALRQIGSINNSTDINDFKLFVDGTQVAQTQSLDTNGYVTFGTPITLRAGARTLKVTADVIGGSSRTVQFSLRGAYDISATDTQFNAGVKAGGSFPFGPVAFTVNSGSMTVVKTTDSQSQNVTVGGSNVSLAKYTFTAFGEPIKVQTLNVGMITNNPTNVTIRNVALYVNGTQVGSTTNVPAAASFAGASGTQFTTNFTVNPGTPSTVEIRGDMFDANTVSGDEIASLSVTTVQAVLIGGSGTQLSNGTPQVSLTPFDVPNTANVLGNTLTIASGSVSVSKTSSYGDQTIVTPATAFKIGSFVVSGNATESVNLNTIYVGWSGSSTSTEGTDLSNLYVTYGGTTTSPKGTVAGTVGATAAGQGNSFSINQTLAVNQTMQFDVYANVATSLSTFAIQTTLAVAGTTASSGIAVYADSTSGNTVLDAGFTGQLITGGSGSIAASLDASTPNSAIVDDSGTVTTAAFKLAATNDSYTLTDATVTVTDGSAVTAVNLMDGATQVASLPPSAGSAAFHGLSVAIPANGTKVLTVTLTMSGVGVGAGATGGALLTTLTAATVRSSGGTNSTPTGLPQAGNATYVYHAYPTITNVALPTSTLAAGTVTLAKFTIASNGGTVGWSKLLFNVTKSITAANGTVTSPTLWDVTSGQSQVTATGSFVTTISGANNSPGTITILPNAEQQVSGSKTYELRATVGGTITTHGDVITTQIQQPSSFASSLKAFKTNAASGQAFYDFAAAPTAVTVNDIRMTANSSVVAAVNNTTVVSTAVNNVRDSYGLTNAAHNGLTVIVSSDGSNNFLSLTGTLCALSGWVCTAKTAADGGGATVAIGAANNTILSIVASKTVNSVVVAQTIFNVTGAAAPGAASTTITLTVTDGAYAVGSSVSANNSDLNLVTVAGVATTASVVWSDVSAAAHGITTADWTNANLMLNLPTSTQNVTY